MAAAAIDVFDVQRVQYIFCLPGSTESSLLSAFSTTERGPAFVLALHEGLVVAMADGYSRVSGHVGVCVLHTTVGSANSLAQLYNSFIDYSAVLALVGHKDSSLFNRGGFCTTDHLPNWFAPVTKHATQVARPQDVLNDLERQFVRASAAPPRPTALVVPQDHWAYEAPDDRRALGARGTALSSLGGADRDALEQLRTRLAAAANPVMLAGDWVHREEAQSLAGTVAEQYGMRIVGEPRRSASRRSWLSSLDRYAGDLEDARELVAASDLVLALGARTFVEFEGIEEPPVDPAALVAVHPNLAEIAARSIPSLAMGGSTTAVLRTLSEMAAPAPTPPSVRPNPATRAGERGTIGPLGVDGLARMLDAELSDDVVVIDEAVRSSPALLSELTFYAGRTYHRSTGGALGWGLGAAIGAQLAASERDVVCLLGDGATMFGVQGLWTAARFVTPVLFVVLNNRGYRAVQEGIERYRGETSGPAAPGVSFDGEPLNFVQLAAGQGVGGMVTSTAEEVAAALEKWRGADGPFLIEHQVPNPLA